MKIPKIGLPMLVLLLGFGFQLPEKRAIRLEIYLLSATSDTLAPENQYFVPNKKEMAKHAFIGNDEILGYHISSDTATEFNRGKIYLVQLSKSGQKKLQNIGNVSMCCGRKFAIAINGKPAVGGYFWNPISTAGCNWMTGQQNVDGNLMLDRGHPYNYFNPQMPDGRENKLLLDAFAKSGRLFRQ